MILRDAPEFRVTRTRPRALIYCLAAGDGLPTFLDALATLDGQQVVAPKKQVATQILNDAPHRIVDHQFDHQTWENLGHVGALCGSRLHCGTCWTTLA